MDKLVEFICPTCNKQLVWAKENSKVLCNVCFDWIELKDLKKPNILLVELDEPQQLSMF